MRGGYYVQGDVIIRGENGIIGRGIKEGGIQGRNRRKKGARIAKFIACRRGKEGIVLMI